MLDVPVPVMQEQILRRSFSSPAALSSVERMDRTMSEISSEEKYSSRQLAVTTTTTDTDTATDARTHETSWKQFAGQDSECKFRSATCSCDGAERFEAIFAWEGVGSRSCTTARNNINITKFGFSSGWFFETYAQQQKSARPMNRRASRTLESHPPEITASLRQKFGHDVASVGVASRLVPKSVGL